MVKTQLLVPFMDLKSQYQSIKDEILSKMAEVFETCAFAGGPFVHEFETKFASAHHAAYCIAVNSGTSALHIVLWGLGIGTGDEVIVPTNTFFATAEAVSLTGATPVFVDCNDDYYNIDCSTIESSITSKTKAIIGVHLYGQSCQLDQLKLISNQYNLCLIEDCAQAHLAKYQKEYVGNVGIAGCFSFYPGKNLGAYGEGGAVITDDLDLYEKLCKIRDHGSDQKYHHQMVGHNYRMDGIQGAVLSVKLKHLYHWTQKRQEVSEWYRESLSDCEDIILPAVHPDAEHVYHLFEIQCNYRDKLQKHLKDHQIQTGLHYPVPCHMQEAYQELGHGKGRFPISEALANRLLSLPMDPGLTYDQVQYVGNVIKEFCSCL